MTSKVVDKYAEDTTPAGCWTQACSCAVAYDHATQILYLCLLRSSLRSVCLRTAFECHFGVIILCVECDTQAARWHAIQVAHDPLQTASKLSLPQLQQQQRIFKSKNNKKGRNIGIFQEMEALMTGTGPLSDSLRRSDPYQPATLPTSNPTPPQQQSQEQLSQQQPLAEQPIRVSLLPGSLKLLTPTQVKNLSWQNHLKLYKVCH